jgi:Outer membrane protein beta-barrel domain
MLTYRLNSDFTIQAGGQYNYLVYADEDLLKDNRDAFKKNEIGLIGGVEYAYSKRLGFYGRFHYGLNDINNINTIHSWNTQQIQLGAAYSLLSPRTAGQGHK